MSCTRIKTPEEVRAEDGRIAAFVHAVALATDAILGLEARLPGWRYTGYASFDQAWGVDDLSVLANAMILARDAGIEAERIGADVESAIEDALVEAREE